MPKITSPAAPSDFDFMIGVTGGLRSGRVDKIIRVDARGALT